MRLEPLVGLRHAFATIVTQPDQSVLTALVILMVLVGARLAFRSVWLAGLAATGVVSLLFLSSFGSIRSRSAAAFWLGAHVFILVRYGLLATAVMLAALNLLGRISADAQSSARRRWAWRWSGSPRSLF